MNAPLIILSIAGFCAGYLFNELIIGFASNY